MIKQCNVLKGVVILGLLLTLSGCFSAKKEDLAAFTRPDMAAASGDQYIIQPPDRLTVIASNIPELQGSSYQVGQTQTVRPDGKISYEHVGEIYVAGKTPEQVAKMISQKLQKMYKLTGDHPVDVRVENTSKLYFILGQVRDPGAKVFSGYETTLSAIARAIPTDLAWKEKVQVIRPSKDPSQPSKIFNLNFRAMSEHGKMDGNVLLENGDIIYVPPTILASIGITMGEIVSPVLSGGAAVRAVQAP